jgi:hypothetical protein
MKLRIRDDSVRLRLTQAEVEAMCKHGVVSASIGFPGGLKFVYALKSSRSCTAPDANLADNVITLSLPEREVMQWAASEQVSIRGEQDLDDGGKLRILVEKDFACLRVRDGEDESDMFANPDVNKGQR